MIHQWSLDELKAFYLSFPIPACLLDRDTRYLAATAKYAEICGTDLERLKGKSLSDFCPRELVANARRGFVAFDDGEEIPPHQISFAGRIYLVSATAVRRGGDAFAFAMSVTLTDISQMKRLEKERAASNAKLSTAYRRMEELAETDMLTGLMNRYGLWKFFARELRHCRRHDKPISMAILDVDGLKLFNDRYGHVAGDETLKAIGTVIQNSIRRPGDGAGRYGGDEFVIVLPNTDLAGTEHVARAILGKVRGLPIHPDHGTFGELSVSIGISGQTSIARNVSIEETIKSLMRSADKALYATKEAGRNGLTVWDEAHQASPARAFQRDC